MLKMFELLMLLSSSSVVFVTFAFFAVAFKVVVVLLILELFVVILMVCKDNIVLFLSDCLDVVFVVVLSKESLFVFISNEFVTSFVESAK